VKETVFPKRIVLHRGGIGVESLLKKQTLQIGLSENNTASFSKGGFLILDFGEEMCGGVRILNFFSKKATARFRFGESLTECCSELGGEKNATNDHAPRDFISELPSFSDLSLGNTGFRFLRLDFTDEVQIKSVVAVNHIYRQKSIYRYEGEDSLIRRIYQVAKRTVDLCAGSGFVWDGVKRDRLIWIGDMHPEMLALTTLYGRTPSLERSLDFVRDQTPLPGWMNGYPTYSMWWIVILSDYYERTGCQSFLKRQLEYLSCLLFQLLSCVEEDGALRFPAYFVDWQTKNTADEIHGVRAIAILAAKKAAFLMKEFGKDPAVAEALLSRLSKVEIAPKASKQVLGLKYFATGLSAEDQKRLVENGAEGMSTFMSYYILKAVASFDREKAIAMMKEYYGAMLNLGATTFWEDFDLSWAERSCRIDAFPQEGETDVHGDFGAHCYRGYRHSLCHGWSAGILQLMREICD